MKATRPKKKRPSPVDAGALPAEDLQQDFPPISLPLQPPFAPAEAKPASDIPPEPGWLYEPKWDGFRCLAFRKGKQLLLQSKAGQPLARYFPELVSGFLALPIDKFVLDGEIVIFRGKHLSFDDLLMRIHPAESRIRKLSVESPVTFLTFDLLVDQHGHSLVSEPLSERRRQLEALFHPWPAEGMVRLSPASLKFSRAERWMQHLGTMGLDGVIAKRIDEPYHSGDRKGMVKIKRLRTADVVVGGFRYASKDGGVGSLLLGLYNTEHKLDHIGFTSSFTASQRQDLKAVVEPLAGGEGFSGNAPGGPSRWSTERSSQWQPLKPRLVCEVRYDHFSGGRFRHGAKFLRWRPEKKPQDCTFQQLEPTSKKDS